MLGDGKILGVGVSRSAKTSWIEILSLLHWFARMGSRSAKTSWIEISLIICSGMVIVSRSAKTSWIEIIPPIPIVNTHVVEVCEDLVD